ncbi:MAG TPA: hypothetical protein VLG74_16740 [Blastocatellia bacterium]|nr:hypothetical protein [Blastocatellia bacterium]
MATYFKIAVIALWLMAVSALALAQSTVTGAIAGTVTDQNKDVVPYAGVTVRK